MGICAWPVRGCWCCCRVLQRQRDFLPHLRVDMFVQHGGENTPYLIPAPVKCVTSSPVQSTSKRAVSSWSWVVTRIMAVQFLRGFLPLLILTLVAGEAAALSTNRG